MTADVFPKFIVEGDSLVIAKSTFHKQLVEDPKDIKGGGLWDWDRDKNIILLYGESFDFGPVTEEDIRACLKAGKLYWSYIGGRKITNCEIWLNTGDRIIEFNNPDNHLNDGK